MYLCISAVFLVQPYATLFCTPTQTNAVEYIAWLIRYGADMGWQILSADIIVFVARYASVKGKKTFLIDDNAEKRCLGEVIVIEFPVSLLFRHLRDDYKKMCVYQPRLHRLPSQRPRHFCWNSFGEVDSTYQEMFPILSLPMDINGGDQLTKHDHFHDSGINCGVVWFGVCRHNELCGDCF